MLEYYEAIEYQLRHFDWKKCYTLSPEEKLRYILLIVDYIFSQENGEQAFADNTKNLLKAFAISVPHERAIAIRDDVALFQPIKAEDRGGELIHQIILHCKENQSCSVLTSKTLHQTVFDCFYCAGADIHFLSNFLRCKFHANEFQHVSFSF